MSQQNAKKIINHHRLENNQVSSGGLYIRWSELVGKRGEKAKRSLAYRHDHSGLYNKCGEEYQDCPPQEMVDPDQLFLGADWTMLGTESQKRQLSPNKSQVTSAELSWLHSVLTQEE